MSDETKFDIGEELYETLRTGQILIDDPHAIKRAYNTRSPEAHERKVARQLQEDALKRTVQIEVAIVVVCTVTIKPGTDLKNKTNNGTYKRTIRNSYRQDN